jgi:hypothetical protein
MSPSTAVRDQNEKFKAYQLLPGFTEYLLISQDAPIVIHYTRQTADKWMREDVTDWNGAVVLAAGGCSLSVREIYEGVIFSVELLRLVLAPATDRSRIHSFRENAQKPAALADFDEVISPCG